LAICRTASYGMTARATSSPGCPVPPRLMARPWSVWDQVPLRSSPVPPQLDRRGCRQSRGTWARPHRRSWLLRPSNSARLRSHCLDSTA